jgi:cutinase
VLGGYSQGASVLEIVAGVPIGGINWGNSLPPQYAGNIAAVATFGDVADRAGGTLPSKSTMLGSKAIDLCNPNDPICHAGPGNEWSGHTEGYVPVYTTQAAAFVASKLVGVGQSVPGYGPSVPGAGPQAPGPLQPGYGQQSPVNGQTPPGSSPSIHGGTGTAPSPAPIAPGPTTPAPQAPLV